MPAPPARSRSLETDFRDSASIGIQVAGLVHIGAIENPADREAGALFRRNLGDRHRVGVERHGRERFPRYLVVEGDDLARKVDIGIDQAALELAEIDFVDDQGRLAARRPHGLEDLQRGLPAEQFFKGVSADVVDVLPEMTTLMFASASHRPDTSARRLRILISNS